MKKLDFGCMTIFSCDLKAENFVVIKEENFALKKRLKIETLSLWIL